MGRNANVYIDIDNDIDSCIWRFLGFSEYAGNFPCINIKAHLRFGWTHISVKLSQRTGQENFIVIQFVQILIL